LIIRGDIASIPLDERFADVCILYYSFHEFTDQNKAADAIARAVKSGGTVAIYEPTMEVGKVQMEKTIELFIERGFITEAKRKRFFTQFAKLRKDGE
jgi:ubiquinone/menaquinone biosynthesis C-methylase UbiE